MENGKFPFPNLALDLDANISIDPISAIHSMQIAPLSFPPSLLQECSQLSNLDIEWLNSFLFGPVKFGNVNNDSHKHSSLPADGGLSLTTRVGEVNNNNNVDGTVVNDSKKAIAGRSKKSVPPRVAFHTRSADDVLDDGYRWRKYGQKAVKNSSHPRSYYRCTHHTCNVKKQIQRLGTDPSVVVTTYEGKHNHPSEKLMETLAPLLKQLQLLTRF